MSVSRRGFLQGLGVGRTSHASAFIAARGHEESVAEAMQQDRQGGGDGDVRATRRHWRPPRRGLGRETLIFSVSRSHPPVSVASLDSLSRVPTPWRHLRYLVKHERMIHHYNEADEALGLTKRRSDPRRVDGGRLWMTSLILSSLVHRSARRDAWMGSSSAPSWALPKMACPWWTSQVIHRTIRFPPGQSSS